MIVKVETLKEWNDVVESALSKGYSWLNYDEEYEHAINSQVYIRNRNQGFSEMFISFRGKTINSYLFNSKSKETISADEYLGNSIYTVSQKDYEKLNLIKNHDGYPLLKFISSNWVWLQGLQAIGTKALLKWFAGDEHIKIVPEPTKYVLWTKDDDDRDVYYKNVHGIPTYDRSPQLADKFDSEEEAENFANNFWTVGEYNE